LRRGFAFRGYPNYTRRWLKEPPQRHHERFRRRYCLEGNPVHWWNILQILYSRTMNKDSIIAYLKCDVTEERCTSSARFDQVN
jgi:hypothetical protein